MALLGDDYALRHRPAAGEWSAVEVVGHMIDKMHIWTGWVERLIAGIRLVITDDEGSYLIT